MKLILFSIGICCVLSGNSAEDVRLDNLDPSEAQQYIEKQDTSLKYAPKVDSNVPAVRYLGNDPYNVLEDIYLAKQYHGQDGLGGYLYGYEVPDIAKTERKKAGGDLRGAYNYIAGNGQEIKVEYWDDGTGFHQVDNVPKALPEDLPEVKAAKEEFLRVWQEQAERNSHPVESPYNAEGEYASGPLSKQGQLERKQQFAAQQPYQNQYSQSQYNQYQPQSSNTYQQKVAQPQNQFAGANPLKQSPNPYQNSATQQSSNNPYGNQSPINSYQSPNPYQQAGQSQQHQVGGTNLASTNPYQQSQPQFSQQSSSSSFQQHGNQSPNPYQQPLAQTAPLSSGAGHQQQGNLSPNPYQQPLAQTAPLSSGAGHQQQGNQSPNPYQLSGSANTLSASSYQQSQSQSSSSSFQQQGNSSPNPYSQPQAQSTPSSIGVQQGNQSPNPYQQSGSANTLSANTYQQSQGQVGQQSSSGSFQQQGNSSPNPYQQPQQQSGQQSSTSGYHQQSGIAQTQYKSSTGQYGPAKPYDSHQKPIANPYQASQSETDNYSGQYSENRNIYSQSNQQNDGNEEENGPPRGFFYSFDYPVGIIVQKQGRANIDPAHSAQKREGNVKDIYAANKELFEKQLAQGKSTNGGSSSSYLYV